MDIISHLYCVNADTNEWKIQTNEDHSNGVAELAQKFAGEFSMGDWGYAMGILHDKGKEQNAFQLHIKKSSGYDNKVIVPQEHNHAYVGGLIAKKILKNEYILIGNPIMGHHRGLYNYTDIETEEKKDIPPEVEIPDDKTLKPRIPSWFRNVNQSKDIHHIIRMLYSCLVDADFLDTEKFMQPDQAKLRGGKITMSELKKKLDTFLSKFGIPTTEVNKIRNEVQQACFKEAEGAPGFFSLTVPTGGGKTISSLVWAVNHAIKNKKKRIIIAIPYTSIIVQTANVLRTIFGEENVLEHHSNVDYSGDNEGELTHTLKLSTENWDYPIIVTTNVQLFESMMSNRPSHCRKLHNICNSILILDEVQTLPIDFMQPIVDSLDCYQRNFGVSVLFTTASQPILTGKHQGTNQFVKFDGLKGIHEIVPPNLELHDRLRRVKLEIANDAQTYDEIAGQLKKHDRVLCIVNTRRDAKELFDRLPKEGLLIHLSRMMCPHHIKEKINEMKQALSDPSNKIIRVISTQLIEAGVDIDFPVVYRQEAGLDSILQAAGRCNREGKLPICTTHVFSLSSEHPLPQGQMTQCNNARRNMGDKHDWFSPEAMDEYFKQLYSRTRSFDKKDMAGLLGKPSQLMMETASKEFSLIDDATTSVIINWEDSSQLVEQLKQQGPSYALIKKLNQFSVSLRQRDFSLLLKQGVIEEILTGIYWVPAQQQYSNDVGLITENQWIEETWII